MDYDWDGDITICYTDYVENLSEYEKDELYRYERRFQKLMAQILDFHHAEIKEFMEECLEYIREKKAKEDEENSQTSESEEEDESESEED